MQRHTFNPASLVAISISKLFCATVVTPEAAGERKRQESKSIECSLCISQNPVQLPFHKTFETFRALWWCSWMVTNFPKTSFNQFCHPWRNFSGCGWGECTLIESEASLGQDSHHRSFQASQGPAGRREVQSTRKRVGSLCRQNYTLLEQKEIVFDIFIKFW